MGIRLNPRKPCRQPRSENGISKKKTERLKFCKIELQCAICIYFFESPGPSMDHQIAAAQTRKPFSKTGFASKKTPRPPVEHQISEVGAVILEIGEVKEYRNRPPYRMVSIISQGASEPEQVVLPGAKAEPHTVMDALVALKAAGISHVILKLASAETWKNRRIESFQVVPSLPVEASQPVSVPTAAATAPAEQPPKPEILETKRYNTSDGGDRQVLRLPGSGPLSKLFEGIGYFKRWYVDDKTFIVPTRQKSKMTYKSSAPRKDGSREVYFSGLKRYSTAAKLNAPTIEVEAVPYNGGLQLTKRAVQ